MKYQNMTKQQLINKLMELQQKISKFETLENEPKRTQDTLVEEKVANLNYLKEQLLGVGSLNEKLKLITDAIVEIFGADFARIWITKEGDLCETDCRHATVTEGPHVCLDRTRCLHLMVSSGRYTSIDGSHHRVPLGCYKIGRVASGEDSKFITNDVTGDPRVHDHEWARTLGLVSFAGFRLLSAEGKPIGVLALFSKLAVVPNEERFLEDLANTTSQVILAGMVEEALRESEEKYRNLVERANDGIIIVQNGIIKFANMRSVEMVGEIIEEVIGTPFTDYIHPDELPQMIDRYKRRITGEHIAPIYETILKRKDGSKVYVEVNGGLITYQGKLADLVIIRDITERKGAEEALRKSEEKYRSILENIAEGYYEVDLAGNFVFFNDSVCQIIGYPREELVGMNNRQYMDQENAKKLYQTFNKVYKTGKPTEEFGWEIIRKDGAKRFIGASVSLIKDSKGQPIGFRGIVRDITERKRTEEALKESEERFRLAFENSRDAIFWADVDTGILIHCNRSAEKLLEMPREAIIGMHQAQLHPPDKTEFYSRMFQNHVMSKGSMDVEAEIITKSGGIIPVYISSSVVQLGKMRINQGIFINVAERKQAEEALYKSEERYRDLFNNINDFIYTHDLEGHFLSVNRSASQTLKYSIDELIGKSISDLMLPEYRQAFKEEYLPKLKKQGFYNGVSIYLTKDGGQRFIEYRSNLVRKEREVAYVSGMGRDITEKIETEKELKKLEKQVQYAQRMEAIGTLSGGIAHDFNNLLMAIQGNASLILLDINPGHPYYEKLKNIEQYVQSGADLTRQLLGFARRGKYETKPTDLNELIKKSSGMFGRTQKGITIHSKYQKDLWTAEVDQGQIEQVFLNLYVNAWQAMPGGGELYLETENVTLDETDVKPYGVEPGKYIKISVTDTGVGIDQATQARIFDPFFTTKEMGRGIGLGLASAYGIIKNHGGIIKVYSEIGTGTTFNIYLPTSEKAALRKKEVVGEILRGTETVLLVDDEEMIRDVGKEILKSLGYKVFLAKSGSEAIEIYAVNRDKIDLVILDMIMPEISGGDTFDRLRAINSSIKVLLSSGYSINGQAQKILDRGCKGFIQKPFNIEDLSRKLRGILEKNSL